MNQLEKKFFKKKRRISLIETSRLLAEFFNGEIIEIEKEYEYEYES